MATMEEKIIQNILEEILFKIFPSVSLDDSLVTDDYVIGMDQEAPSGTNGEDTPDKPKCDRDVPDVHELPSYSKVEEEEFHVEVVKKPLIGSSEDEGQMKEKIEDDEKSSNQVSEVNEEEFHYEVIKKPMIGASGDVGQMKDKIKDDEKSSNLVPKVDEEEFHYEVMKKPMIGAGGDVGQMKDKIKDNEKPNDLMYHFSGLPKPQFMNLPPRLGLSRKSNLPPLHKRQRIEEGLSRKSNLPPLHKRQHIEEEEIEE